MKPSSLCLTVITLYVALTFQAVLSAPALTRSSSLALGHAGQEPLNNDVALFVRGEDGAGHGHLLDRFRRQLPQMEGRRHRMEWSNPRHGRRGGRHMRRRMYEQVRRRPKPIVINW